MSKKERQRKINTILQLIIKCGETGANKRILMAQCCRKWASARRTVQEYISMLVGTGEIRQKKETKKGPTMLYANTKP